MSDEQTQPAGSLHKRVRGRRMRRRVVALPAPAKEPVESRHYSLTESEFVAWIRTLAADPKWKRRTPWDEHTFCVGVMTELRRVKSPNAKGQP